VTSGGRRAVSGSGDHSLNAWDLESRHALQTPQRSRRRGHGRGGNAGRAARASPAPRQHSDSALLVPRCRPCCLGRSEIHRRKCLMLRLWNAPRARIEMATPGFSGMSRHHGFNDAGHSGPLLRGFPKPVWSGFLTFSHGAGETGRKRPGADGNENAANPDGIRLFGIVRDRPGPLTEGSNPVGATKKTLIS
jgi:hypothetical protein